MLDIVAASDCIIEELIFGTETAGAIAERQARWRRHGVPGKAIAFATGYNAEHGCILLGKGCWRMLSCTSGCIARAIG